MHKSGVGLAGRGGHGLFQKRRLPNVVLVQKSQELSIRQPGTVIAGGRMSAVLGPPEVTGLGKSQGQAGGLIGGGVIHHDQLTISERLSQHAHDRLLEVACDSVVGCLYGQTKYRF